MTGIPDTWRIIIVREDGAWKAIASKQDGCRKVEVATYDSPQESFDKAIALLEERIKS